MVPSPISVDSFCSVTFATASPTTSFQGSLANYGRSATILHGELYGLLIATLLAKNPLPYSDPLSPPTSQPSLPLPISSDHLNAVTFLTDASFLPPLPHKWSSVPARSLYRWLLSLLASFPTQPSIHHVHAHTNASDPASLANSLVDSLASSAHSYPIPPLPVPLPTFFMDKFVPYLPPFQYIESGLPRLLQSLQASQSFFNSSFVLLQILSPFSLMTHTHPLLTPTPPPPLYTLQLCSSMHDLASCPPPSAVQPISTTI